MQILVFLIATLGLFISLAGIIYPFKPFKTRKRALLSLAACFLLAGTIVGTLAPSPSGQTSQTVSERNYNAPEPANQADSQSTLDPASAQRDKAQPIADEGSSVTITGTENTEEISNLPPQKEVQDIWNAFDTLNWKHASRLVTVMKNKGYEAGDLFSELEVKTLAIVKPLPASDYDFNLAGYELLAAIRPHNTIYAQKVTQYSDRKKQARRSAVERLRKKEDKIDGITWFYHPNRPKYLNSRSTVYLYIGRKGEHGAPTIRMKTVYAGSSWLFVNNVSAWHDGIKESFVSGYFEKDNNSRIWEWRDDIPSGYQIEVLKSLANAREAILRFEGDQYRKDVTLSAGDKRAIREVLLAYEVMKSGN